MSVANAFILSNFGVAGVNFVYEGFERKDCLNFYTCRLLAFFQLRSDPWATAPSMYNLCSFCRSLFERDPASSFFGSSILIQYHSLR